MLMPKTYEFNGKTIETDLESGGGGGTDSAGIWYFIIKILNSKLNVMMIDTKLNGTISGSHMMIDVLPELMVYFNLVSTDENYTILEKWIKKIAFQSYREYHNQRKN